MMSHVNSRGGDMGLRGIEPRKQLLSVMISHAILAA